MASVSATTTIDFEGMAGRLLDAERAVLAKGSRAILAFIRSKWVDWEYKTRPVNAPRNVSFRAWTSTLQTTEAPYSLVVANDARGYATGLPYVAYVHRAGDNRKYYTVLADEINVEILPGMLAHFKTEFQKAMGPRERKKLRSRGTTERTRFMRAR